MSQQKKSTLLTRLGCLIGKHDERCVQEIVLLPKEGFVLHDHYCTTCTWTEPKPDKKLSQDQFNMLTGALDRRKAEQRERPAPLMN